MRGYKRLTRDVGHLIKVEKALGIHWRQQQSIANGVATNRWEYETNPRKVERFREWIRGKIGSDLAGDTLIQHYIDEAYKKGAKRAKDDAKPDVVDAIEYLHMEGVTDTFAHAFLGRATVEKVKLLSSRTFSELDGINQMMASKMSRALADGLTYGRSVTEISNQLVKEVNVASGRALMIVRTEMVRAHAEGQLDAMERLGVTHVGAQVESQPGGRRSTLGIAVEWDTANDDKVCKLCAPLEGIILKIKEARGMLPRHPNCRCCWLPAELASVAYRRARKKKEQHHITEKREVQRAIRRSQKAQGNGEEWGPNKEIGVRK